MRPFVVGLAAFLISIPASAYGREVALGLVTTHLMTSPEVSQRFSGCVTPTCEVIVNPIIAYRMVLRSPLRNYLAVTSFAGVNSIHQPIFGTFGSLGTLYGPHGIGLTVGAYFQDNTKFAERGLIPFTMGQIEKVGVVPLFGMEHQYRFTKHIFSNTLITPAIANIGLGFSW